MKDRKDSSYLTLQTLIKANVQLAIVKGALVLPTQPLQVIVRAQQANLAHRSKPRYGSAIKTATEIYRYKNSVLPFFKGGGIGVGKEIVKNGLYKGALITGAPMLADSMIAPTLSNIQTPRQYHFVKATVAGVIAAVGETILGGILDGWATFLATSLGENEQSRFWREVAQSNSVIGKLKRAYRGAGVSTLKNTMAFSTYFAASQPIKELVINMYGVTQSNQLSWHANLLSAFLLGSTVAISSSAFDIIKTQYQMPNPSNKTIFRALHDNFQTYGIKGITAGLPLKFVMVTLGWAFTNIAIQGCHLEKEHEYKTRRPR